MGIIQSELDSDTVDSSELGGCSLEFSGLVFFRPRGRWTEVLCYLGVREANRGFIFTVIVDFCWQLFFWVLWVLVVLGE